MYRIVLALVTLCCASRASAQSEDLIGREIDRATESAVFEIAPFYLTPGFAFNTGYDSNAILAGTTANPDFTTRATPDIEAVLRLRGRALIELQQELDFVYFRNLENLRNIGTDTRVGGTTGGKNLLLSASGQFRSEKIRPSREVDIPVDQDSRLLNASLVYSLGVRTELLLEVDDYRVVVDDQDVVTGGIPLKSRLDRVERSYRFDAVRHVSNETSASLGVLVGSQVFDDETVGRDADRFGVFAGVELSPAGNIRGKARLGYERLEPEVALQPRFSGLVGDGDVWLRLNDRFGLGGFYSREVEPSVFLDFLFVVQSRWGAALDIYLGPQFFVRPGFELGNNDYPETVNAPSDPSRVQIRNLRQVSVDFNYRLSETWLVALETEFSRRDTFTPGAIEDRAVVNLGLRATY